jgi:hypothetical protein
MDKKTCTAVVLITFQISAFVGLIILSQLLFGVF